jgi:hypothetical protein
MTTMTPRSTAPTTLTARCPDDVLALVPVLLGFVPTDSVAMLTFGAAHAFHARVDRPDDAEAVAEVVHLLLAPARRHRARQVAFVVYGPDDEVTRLLARQLRRAFARAGIRVVEMLRADGGRWFPLTGDRSGGPGVPYDVAAHPFLAQAVLRGQVTHRSRHALAASLAADPERAGRVAELVAALVAERPDRWLTVDGLPAEELLAEGEWVHGLVSRLTASGGSPTDDEVARLLCAIQVRRVRDAAWCPLRRATAPAHVSFWTDVCRRTPAELLAPPATLLGWAAWQSGHGALAWCAADLAGACDPDYTLTRYLTHALEHAIPPTVWESGWDWKEGLRSD